MSKTNKILLLAIIISILMSNVAMSTETDMNNNGIVGDETPRDNNTPAVPSEIIGKDMQTVIFPSYEDSYTLLSYPYWWHAGDRVVGKRSLALPSINKVDMNLQINENLLYDGGYVDMFLSINGKTVGTWTVNEWDTTIWRTFTFPPINGPIYDIRIVETNDVYPGLGSIRIRAGFSTLTFYGQQPPLGNLLKNPGFEMSNGPKPLYWEKFQTGKAIFSYPEPGRVGKAIALAFPIKQPSRMAIWQQKNIPVTPFAQYKLSGYMRLQGVIGSNVLPRNGGASIRVNWFDASGKLVRIDFTNKKGNTPWVKYERVFIAPHNAVKASVGGDLFDTSGKVWFDDFSFVRVS